jgi:hypothetical protein
MHLYKFTSCPPVTRLKGSGRMLWLLGCLLFSVTAQAQYHTKPKPKEVDIAGNKISIPKECTLVNSRELTCDTYKIKWVYMPEGSDSKMGMLINGSFDNRPSPREEPCTLLGKPARCIRNGWKEDNRSGHRITAYSELNGQSVIVYFTVFNNQGTISNKDLPETVGSFFQFQE